MFLSNQGLIQYDKYNSTVSIQTAGFIKIKTKSFSKEISDAKWNQIIQRLNQIITPVIALAALSLSIYSSFFKKDVPNCDYKIRNTNKKEYTH